MVDNMSTSRQSPAAADVPVIEAVRLHKRFGDTVAVDGLSFTVPSGSILGLLGPNGAGKTTTIKLLTTLLPIDEGSARVAGYDVATEADSVRSCIGLAGQSAAVDDKLTARQNLDLFGRLYHLPGPARRARVDELVERFGMTEYANRSAETLSGGERRRLDLVAALIADPPAIFLDEPTTGLDPRGRLALWQQIREIRDAGAAVVLTTQYLEEADQLADSIVVIDRGTAVAAGTAARLKARLERDVLQVTLDDPRRLSDAITALDPGNAIAIDDHTAQLAVGSAAEGLAALRRVDDAGIIAADFQLRRPTLDDVFIEITGEPAGQVERAPQERAS
jgi:ABC-2 type transport system ATP-binding protein